ncbi:hypothetical protein GC173_07490 [bacterium]|nr:hypothetical protein [bacterium]
MTKRLAFLLANLMALMTWSGVAAQSAEPAAKLDKRTVISALATENNLPSYSDLRFSAGTEQPMGESYLPGLLTVAQSDVLTSGIVFPWVGKSGPYAELSLSGLVSLAVENNLDLQNTRRDLTIARSQLRSAESDFIPYVDLIGESRYSFDRDANATRVDGTDTRNTTRDADVVRTTGGVESGVQLPTGGNLTVRGTQGRTDTNTTDGSGTLVDGTTYDSNASIRYIQPLLRGAGPEVAQADLRRARLREADQILSQKLSERDTVLEVINAYFSLLQVARQLKVSSDAIRIRTRFLEETRVKFDVGRVDESEILRAEIQYLSEQETAIGRLRQLDDARDRILILLGLPLDTPISFVDITDRLAESGRVDIPETEDAVTEALNNRMELMRQDIAISLSEIDTRVARNAVLPQLDFDAGYGRSDSDRRYLDANGFENQGWDAGLTFRMPLVNIDRREAARRATISLDQRRTSRLSSERSLISDVLSTHRRLLTTEAQLTLLRKNVEQARRSLELINGKFEVGFATVTEVRLAQDDLFNAETRYSDAILNYQIQVARLYVALGRPLQ